MSRRNLYIGAVLWLILLMLLVFPNLKKVTTALQAEQYTILNPRADLPDIIAHPLAPRLSSLEGKTVYVNGLDSEISPGTEIMVMIARGMAKAITGIRVVYISDRYGDAVVDPMDPSIRIVSSLTDAHNIDTLKEAEQKADAVVTGLSF